MRSGFLCLVLVMFALSVQTAADDLRADARLHKAVNLQLHTALLDEVMQEIGRQTGVAFLLDDSLQEQKATLFVSEKPAWQVINNLTQVLGIRCEREGEVYRLVSDPELQRLEQSLLSWRRNTIRRSAETKLSTWARYAKEDYAVILQRVTQLEEQMAKLEQEKPPGWQERRAALAAQLEPLKQIAHLERFLAGRLYRQMPASVWERLWRGEMLWFSHPHAPNTLLLPPESLHWKAIQDGTLPVFMYLGIRFRFQEERLRLMMMSLPEGALPSTVVFSDDREQLYIPADVSHSLMTRWEKWQTPPEEIEKNPVLRRARMGNRQVTATRSAEPTVADWLSMIAKEGKMQVVADAFRLPSPPISIGSQHNTLASWLKEFVIQQGGYLRVEGDWLLFRHGDYWSLRLSEPPERLVREMERKASEGTLYLEDYAVFTASLTPEAQARIEDGEPAYSARFDLTPLKGGMPALRFWASLTDAQKRTAIQRQPIPYLQLTPAQQQLFREALEAKRVPFTLLPILFASDGNVDPQLAFLVERWSLPAYSAGGENLSITAESLEELEQQRHLLPPDTNSKQVPQALFEQIAFYFGIDALHSVRYELTISKKSP